MENLQDKIKAYVNNQLTGTELAEFKAQLATDTVLQQEVQDTKDVLFVFQNEKLLAVNTHLRHLRETVTLEPDDDFNVDEFLKKVEETPQNSQNTEGGASSSPISKYWWWSASFALLGILGGVLYQNQQKKTALKDLSAQFISSETKIPEANTKQFDNTPIDLAIKQYIKKEYTQAIPHFINHIKQSKPSEDNYDVHLYLGFSYLMTQENEKAMKELTKVVQGDYSNIPIKLSPSGRYYYVLAQMAAGKTDSVHHYLNQIMADEKFGADASALLVALDKAGIK